VGARSPFTGLVRKAISACTAAIEIYNKPGSKHREETFAILVVSAWEALLKARLVKESGIKAIHVLESWPGGFRQRDKWCFCLKAA